MNAPQQRTVDVALSSVRDEGGTLHGHAAVYNALSEDLGGYVERIAPGAFSDVLATEPDVRLLVNHKPDHVLARTKSGTLRLHEDEHGLAFTADLPDTAYARDLRESLRRGDLDGASFRFCIGDEDWGREDGREVRTVKRVASLMDVCIATYPAYPSASVELRTRPTDTPADGDTMDTDTTPTGLRTEDRTGSAGPAPIEDRVRAAIRETRKGEARSLTTAANSAGPITPAEVSTFLWDRLRPVSVALATGMMVIPTERSKVTWPRLVADVDPQWIGELEQIPTGDPAFSTLEANPKKLAHRVSPISNEVIDDSEPSAVDVLNQHLTTMLALKLDASIFEGNQGANPDSIKGLKYVTGIQTISMGTNGGALTSYDAIIRAVGLLRAANVPGPYVAVTHPTVLTGLELLKTATGSNEQLARPEGLPSIFTTSQLSTTETQGTATNASSIYVYAPSQIVLVRRQDATVELDRSRLFDIDASEIRGKLRADLIVPNPQAVVRISGVTPAA